MCLKGLKLAKPMNILKHVFDVPRPKSIRYRYICLNISNKITIMEAYGHLNMRDSIQGDDSTNYVGLKRLTVAG